jgi:HD domain-containing protein
MTAVPEDLAAWARDLARRYLDVPRFQDARWPHVRAVGAKAAKLAPAYGSDGEVLIAAAWLHDVGYASDLAVTGFHPLDGGRFVAGLGADRVAALVAHHSGAAIESELRGLAEELAEFPDERGPVRDALWTCDMTTSPVGRPVTFDERLAEITERYGPEHPVPRAIAAAGDDIRRAIKETSARAAAAGIEFEL